MRGCREIDGTFDQAARSAKDEAVLDFVFVSGVVRNGI